MTEEATPQEWQALGTAVAEQHWLKVYHLRTRNGKLRRLARLLAIYEGDLGRAVTEMVFDGQLSEVEAYRARRFFGQSQ
jgi:hypothetical protein